MKFFFLTAALVVLLGEASAINATTLKSNIMDQVNNTNDWLASWLAGRQHNMNDWVKVKTGSQYVNCRTVIRTEYCKFKWYSNCPTAPHGYYMCSTQPGFYGNDERATIELLGPGELYFPEFETEAGYDYVTIGGLKYYGDVDTPGKHTIPAGKAVDVVWFSDSSVKKKGWRFTFIPSSAAPPACTPNCEPGVCTHNCPYVTRIACSPGQQEHCVDIPTDAKKKIMASNEGFTSYDDFEKHEMRWGWPQWYKGSAIAFGVVAWAKGSRNDQNCCSGQWDTPGKDTAPGICAALGCNIKDKEALYQMCNSQACKGKAGNAVIQATPFIKYTSPAEDKFDQLKVPNDFQANAASCCSIAGRCARWGCKILDVGENITPIKEQQGKDNKYKTIRTACKDEYYNCRTLSYKGKNQIEWIAQRY